MHAHYNEISGKIESFIAKEIDHDNARKQNLPQLEKVKMPLFTGRIRDYLIYIKLHLKTAIPQLFVLCQNKLMVCR